MESATLKMKTNMEISVSVDLLNCPNLRLILNELLSDYAGELNYEIEVISGSLTNSVYQITTPIKSFLLRVYGILNNKRRNVIRFY